MFMKLRYLFGGAAFAVTRLDRGSEINDRNRKRTSGIYRNGCSTLYNHAARKAEQLCELHTIRNGLPGVCIAVSVNGRIIWKYAFGYADLENGVRLHSDSVMRIASISKCFTAVLAAKLYEAGELNLDARIQRYVSEFPEKFWPSEPNSADRRVVDITLRQLLSHQSGIRHYSKVLESTTSNSELNSKAGKPDGRSVAKVTNESSVKVEQKEDRTERRAVVSEFEHAEYYLRTNYKTVTDSLVLFKDDPLLLRPGSGYLYTTHGYTLAACALERADSRHRDFLTQLNEFFGEIGLRNTHADLEEKIVPDRTRYYRTSKDRSLSNVPFVDNSYKWAGGGLLSNCPDLLRFAHAILYAFQYPDGILKQDTVCTFWQPQIRLTRKTSSASCYNEAFYALGFVVGNPHLSPSSSSRNAYNSLVQASLTSKVASLSSQDSLAEQSTNTTTKLEEKRSMVGCGKQDYFFVEHTGGAVGATSILLIVPDIPHNLFTFAACNADLSDLLRSEGAETNVENSSVSNALFTEYDDEMKVPKGICVAVLCNMQSAPGLSGLAHKVVELFMDAYYKDELAHRYSS